MHHCNEQRNGYAEETLAAREPLPYALSTRELEEATHVVAHQLLSIRHTSNRATQHHVAVSSAHTVTTGTSRNHDVWLHIHVRPSRTRLHRRPGWFVTLLNNAWSNDRNRCGEGTRGNNQYCRAARTAAIRYSAAVQASCARKVSAQRALRNEQRHKSVVRYNYIMHAC